MAAVLESAYLIMLLKPFSQWVLVMTSDDSIEHMKRDLAFDFENQTKCLVISTNRLLGWENDKTDDS